VPEAEVVLSPACDAVMTQLPVLVRVTVAEERPVLSSTVETPTEHAPLALKLTSCPFATPLVWAVAVTGSVEAVMIAELGNWPRTMVWVKVSTAGVDGALERGAGFEVSGTTVVAIV
jgi:hypothetical protein